MKSEIEFKIRTMIANQAEVFKETINLEADLQKDLELDNIEMTLLVLAVEEEFGLKIPPDEDINFRTGQDIVEYVYRKASHAS